MEKNMKDNFEKMEKRIFDTLYNTDLEKINYELRKIQEPILFSGVGGSSVVATYASKIINEKNKIISTCVEPRDLSYMNIKGYKNVCAVSYSGNNYGVDLTFNNELKHYLLASKRNEREGITNLTYKVLDKEKSFVSLAATLIPCSVMLNYYLDNNKERIIDLLDEYHFDFDTNCDAYEIFSGHETSTASKYLESTMIESGIGIPVIHDKYSFCHGRSTLSTVYNNIAIYFNLNTDFDKLLIDELRKCYKDVIVIDTYNSLLSEFLLLQQCMYLTKYIAEKNNKDISGVDYNPIVKKIYNYNGNI